MGNFEGEPSKSTSHVEGISKKGMKQDPTTGSIKEKKKKKKQPQVIGA